MYTKEQSHEAYLRRKALRSPEQHEIDKARIRKYHKDNHKELYARHKPKIKAYNLKYARKYYSRIENKIARNIRIRLYVAVKTRGIEKADHTMKLLGCTKKQLLDHLERKFTEGMTWDNYGQWEIDHIIPISSVDLSKPEEQARIAHFTNLQPLWKVDNQTKSNKLEA